MNRVSLIVACLGLASLAAVAGCGGRAETMPAPLEPIVMVIHPQHHDMVTAIDLPGDLVGYYEAALHSKVTGYAESMSVDKGDWVKKGQVLAVLQVPELRSNLEHARANLAIQRITYDRLRKVQQTDPRLVSQQDVDVAYANFKQAQASVQTLDTMVGYTQIVAPFDGVITGRFADPGALIRAGGGDFGLNETSGLVSPGATEGAGGHRSGGGPVFTLADIDSLRVYTYVPEKQCPLIHRGTRAILTFDSFPDQKLIAYVSRFASALDLSTRTMLTEIDIKNPGHRLYPRMYAHVSLELVRHLNALRIPTAALGGAGKDRYVYVVEQGRLKKVPVQTGIENGDFVEITSGLTAGQAVVQTYSDSLSNGEQVQAQPSNAEQAS